jgi:hypothetical protein
MANDVATLPLPEHLEPKKTKRSLMTSVRIYFYALYNAADGTFKKFLASVGNKDSVTKHRIIDRVRAIDMIKASAKDAKDSITGTAKDGDILKCLSKIMLENGQGLKLRRREYQRLTQSAE